MRLKPSYMLMLCAMGIVPAAFAQQKTDDNVMTTNTVIVTAKRAEQDLLQAQPTVNVVKAEDKIVKGATLITDMVKDIPGVELVTDGTPGINVINIRGEKEGRTVLLVDGQRVDDQKTKSGTPLLVNPFFIDSIEVVKGPASVLYGSDAMGGVVNVIKKKASDDRLALEGGVTYDGSGNGATEYLSATGTIDALRYGLAAVHTDVGDIYLSGRERLDNTAFRNKGVEGFVEYDFNDYVTAGVAAETYDTSSQTSTTVGGSYKDFRANIPKWQRNKYSAFVRLHDLNDYVNSIEAKVFVQENDKDFNSKSKISLFGPFYTSIDVNTLNEQKTTGASLQADLSFGDRFNLITGYEYKKDDLDSKSSALVDVLVPTAGGKPGQMAMSKHNYDIAYTDSGYKQESNAVFALLSTTLTDALTLNTGLRYTHIKTLPGTTTGSIDMSMITIPPSATKPPVNMSLPFTQLTHKKTTNDRIVGSAGLVYDINDVSSVRFNWSQGFRAPTIQDLCLITFTGEQQNGNPNLTPETSNNYEIGYRYEDPAGISFDIAAFFTDSKNYISKVKDDKPGMGSRTAFTFENIANAKTYGIETSFAWQLGDFKPYSSFTYLQRKFETDTINTYNTGTPSMQGTTGLAYSKEFDTISLDLDVNARYASETRYHEEFGYFGENSYGGYTVYNASAAVLFGEDRQYTAFVAINNITDKSYQTNELIHEAGRFLSAGFNAKF